MPTGHYIVSQHYPQVEMIFKSNLLGSAGKMPTIVSPEMYRERYMFTLSKNSCSSIELN